MLIKTKSQSSYFDLPFLAELLIVKISILFDDINFENCVELSHFKEKINSKQIKFLCFCRIMNIVRLSHVSHIKINLRNILILSKILETFRK